MTKFEKQQNIINTMYKKLGSDRLGCFVTVGFSRQKPKSIAVVSHRTIEDNFFIFNNLFNNFIEAKHG